jgi:hypothetical protein
MVISQFGKIIRFDPKSIRAAGRSTRASRSPNLKTPGQSSRYRIPEEAKIQPEEGTLLE